jgi:hypothetical protein
MAGQPGNGRLAGGAAYRATMTKTHAPIPAARHHRFALMSAG